MFLRRILQKMRKPIIIRFNEKNIGKEIIVEGCKCESYSNSKVKLCSRPAKSKRFPSSS